MMRNSLWNRDLFDGFMNDMFEDDFFGGKNPLYGKHAEQHDEDRHQRNG